MRIHMARDLSTVVGEGGYQQVRAPAADQQLTQCIYVVIAIDLL